jgi:hypothetical protein
MKKYYIFKAFLLFILSVEVGFGQSGTNPPYYKQFTEKQVPPSPNVASLGKYGDTPVSYYTGIPNISIPIYDIKTKDLSMPINLSYHSSAIRVEEEASIVGLGWSLNAGGVISRNIRGSKGGAFDSYFKLGTPSCIETMQAKLDNPNARMRGVKDNYTYVMASQMENCLGSNGSGGDDFEPDIFTFNVGGQNGKFFLDRPEPGNTTGYSVKILSQETFKVKLIENDITGVKGFEIITDDGTKYSFTKKEFQKSEIEGTPVNTGKNMVLNSNGEYIDAIPYTNIPSEPFDQIIAWHLTSIESAQGDKITLTYTDSNKFTRALNSRTQSISSSRSELGPAGCAPPDFTYSWNQTRIYNKPVYLESILFDNGKVYFAYGYRDDLSDKGVPIIADVPAKQQRLGHIIISKFDGTSYSTLKEYILGNDGYFDSGTGRPNHLSKRLKLSSIKEFSGTANELPPYTFDYENTVNLPDKDSYSIDHWGYYNGYNNTSLIPNSTLLTVPNVFYGFGVGANRNIDNTSDNRFLKSGTIKKITYPTGGSTIFTFEPNDFTNSRSSFGGVRPIMLDRDFIAEKSRDKVKGAGLRISRIDDQLENGTIASTKIYDYKVGRHMMPVEYFTSKYLFTPTPCNGGSLHTISSQNIFSSLSAGGNTVGYDQVEVTDLNKTLGKKVYYYENKPQLQNSYFYFYYNSAIPVIDTTTKPASNIYFTYNPDAEWNQSFITPIGDGSNGIISSTCFSFFNVPSVINNMNGTLLREDTYRADNNLSALTLLKKVVYNNSLENKIKGKGYKISSSPTSFTSEIISYDIISSWTKLNSTTEYNYDNATTGDEVGNELSALKSTSLFEYNSTYRQIKKKINTDSKGTTYISTYDYPYDINSCYAHEI